MRPGKRVAAGDRIHFGHDGNSCFLGQLDATVIEKREAGEVLLGFDLSGPFLDEALHAVGHIPLPPYIASKRADDERDRDRLPDHLCPRGRRGRRAHGRPAFHAGAVRSARRAGHRAPFRDAACRRRHLSAGQGRRHGRPQDACRDRLVSAKRPPRHSTPPRRGAGASSRSAPLRCACWKAPQGQDGTLAAWSGATDIFITPGYRFKTADVLMTNFHLPRSTLFMLVSAFSRARHDARGLCARHRKAATDSTPTATRACFSERRMSDGR